MNTIDEMIEIRGAIASMPSPVAKAATKIYNAFINGISIRKLIKAYALDAEYSVRSSIKMAYFVLALRALSKEFDTPYEQDTKQFFEKESELWRGYIVRHNYFNVHETRDIIMAL